MNELNELKGQYLFKGKGVSERERKGKDPGPPVGATIEEVGLGFGPTREIEGRLSYSPWHYATWIVLVLGNFLVLGHKKIK